MTPEERFWERVDKTGNCWLWTTSPWAPYRRAYLIANGPIPEGLVVCHVCDVRQCVRPSHLFLGTQKDNMRDCVQKGRHYSQTELNRQRIKERWQNPEYRQQMSDKLKRQWEDPELRERMKRTTSPGVNKRVGMGLTAAHERFASSIAELLETFRECLVPMATFREAMKKEKIYEAGLPGRV